jgi:hypothetical protein
LQGFLFHPLSVSRKITFEHCACFDAGEGGVEEPHQVLHPILA